MAFHAIFGGCFPFYLPVGPTDQGRPRGGAGLPLEMADGQGQGGRATWNTGYSDYYRMMVGRSTLQTPVTTMMEDDNDDEESLPQRPVPVRSHTCPTSTRNTGNSPYGPLLTIHDAQTANELFGSSSSLGNGQYSFLNGEFIPRPLSGIMLRRASAPGTAVPQPIHTHNRAAQSLGDLRNPAFSNIASPLLTPVTPARAHCTSSPLVVETRMDSVSESRETSFEDSLVDAVVEHEAPRSNGSGTALTVMEEEDEEEEEAVETVSTAPTDSKAALERIKIAREEKATLERRLQELEKLISGKTVQHSHTNSSSSIACLSRVSGAQHSRNNSTTESGEQVGDDSEQPASGVTTRSTSFEDDASDMEIEPYSPPAVTTQRQRPRLPQIQTALPLPGPATGDDQQATPSTAVRLASAVSRIAHWFFNDEDRSGSACPSASLPVASPQRPRAQHAASTQSFQLIQAHHLQLTPTSPPYNHRRLAHLSAPTAAAVPVATASPAVAGYQQRWRPRNVEDVDPVPPYYEQDPNPSPGFVFFPQNSLFTPMQTPTNPVHCHAA